MLYYFTYNAMEKTKNDQFQKIRDIFDEDNLDLIEQKFDAFMGRLVRLWWGESIIHHRYTEDILACDFVHSTNAKMYPHLKTIFLVVGRILLVSGVVGVFSSLLGLTGLGFVFSFGFGMGLRVILYLLVSLAVSLLSLCAGIGMIRRKKWLPSVLVISFFATIAGLIVSSIPSGFIVGAKYGSFGNALLQLILFFVLVVLVFKNKELFHT